MENVTLHPLVVINISDHLTRVRANADAAAAPPRVFGAVLGTQAVPVPHSPAPPQETHALRPPPARGALATAARRCGRLAGAWSSPTRSSSRWRRRAAAEARRSTWTTCARGWSSTRRPSPASTCSAGTRPPLRPRCESRASETPPPSCVLSASAPQRPRWPLTPLGRTHRWPYRRRARRRAHCCSAARRERHRRAPATLRAQ